MQNQLLNWFVELKHFGNGFNSFFFNFNPYSSSISFYLSLTCKIQCLKWVVITKSLWNRNDSLISNLIVLYFQWVGFNSNLLSRYNSFNVLLLEIHSDNNLAPLSEILLPVWWKLRMKSIGSSLERSNSLMDTTLKASIKMESSSSEILQSVCKTE